MKPYVPSTLILAAALALSACGDSTPPARAPASADAAKASSQNVYDRVAAEGSGFTVGSMMAARTVYVFFDAQCPHCATLWHESKPVLSQIKMVWMPVRLLADISAQQGAAILAASDPAGLMDKHEELRGSGGKGLEPSSSTPKEALDKVRSNTALMSAIGAGSVPTLVFKDPSGKAAMYEG